jgi:hypothetical protein
MRLIAFPILDELDMGLVQHEPPGEHQSHRVTLESRFGMIAFTARKLVHFIRCFRGIMADVTRCCNFLNDRKLFCLGPLCSEQKIVSFLISWTKALHVWAKPQRLPLDASRSEQVPLRRRPDGVAVMNTRYSFALSSNIGKRTAAVALQ